MNSDEIKKINIPKNPGCYLFKDKKGTILYVGKAVDLRSRVSSYWRESADHSPAKFSMLKKIDQVEWIEVDSEIEALLLEANLIKKHSPEYNIVMRDDKRYIYIKVATEDEYPRIFATRNLDKSGRFFGPFVSADAVYETLKIVRKIWPYRSCAHLPKKTCLYYRINKCPGCCEKFITKAEYGKIIKQIVLFLEGRKSEIIKNHESQIAKLEKEIFKATKNNKPTTDLSQEINGLKYQLLNLKKILSHSRILSIGDKYAADVVELAKILALPKVPQRIEGYDISNLQGKDAVGSMVVFEGGEPNKNEYRRFKIRNEELEGDVWMLKEVIERRAEHLREFEISQNQKSQDKEIWNSPDLIIVDGGKAQLNTIVRILKKYKLDIPVIAVSKGEGLRSAKAPDKIFFPGQKKPLELPLASPALHVIKRVRDEAHRFAIEYHRAVRKKRMR